MDKSKLARLTPEEQAEARFHRMLAIWDRLSHQPRRARTQAWLEVNLYRAWPRDQYNDDALVITETGFFHWCWDQGEEHLPYLTRAGRATGVIRFHNGPRGGAWYRLQWPPLENVDKEFFTRKLPAELDPWKVGPKGEVLE